MKPGQKKWRTVRLSIQITLALVAVGFSLIFVSERLADTASRIIEAAFNAVEYQLALQAGRHFTYCCEPESLCGGKLVYEHERYQC